MLYVQYNNIFFLIFYNIWITSGTVLSLFKQQVKKIQDKAQKDAEKRRKDFDKIQKKADKKREEESVKLQKEREKIEKVEEKPQGRYINVLSTSSSWAVSILTFLFLYISFWFVTLL